MNIKNFCPGTVFLRLGLWISCGLLCFTIIHAQNNVGIGTISPVERLHVNGGNIRLSGTILASNPSLFISSSNTFTIGGVSQTHNIGINFEREGDWVGSVRHVWSSNPSAAAPNVLRLSSSAANANDLVIDNQGRVGIGRRNPTSRLHVEGNLKTEGSITATGLLVSGTSIFSNNVSFIQTVNISGNLSSSAKIVRPQTGNNNLVPVCYGRVGYSGKWSTSQVGNAVVLGGTGNFTAQLMPLNVDNNTSRYYQIHSQEITRNSIVMVTIGTTDDGASFIDLETIGRSLIPVTRVYNGYFQVWFKGDFFQRGEPGHHGKAAFFHFLVFNP